LGAYCNSFVGQFQKKSQEVTITKDKIRCQRKVYSIIGRGLKRSWAWAVRQDKKKKTRVLVKGQRRQWDVGGRHPPVKQRSSGVLATCKRISGVVSSSGGGENFQSKRRDQKHRSSVPQIRRRVKA